MLKNRPVLVGSMVVLIGGSTVPACEARYSGCTAASLEAPAPGGYTTQACPGTTPAPLPLDQFPTCKMKACFAAHCLPKAVLPATVPVSLLAECEDPNSVCVPDDYAVTLGQFKPKTCTSIKGAEGRCISTCIPQVNGLMDVLPKGGCGEYEACAPCINPNDGTETGACTQGCDTGPSPQTVANPIVFPKCQGDNGVCVPQNVVPGVLITQLVQDTCAFGEVCAPVKKTQDLKYNFPACTPSNPLVLLLAAPGPSGQLGGCVPSFLADNNPLEGLFMVQDSCLPGEKCAACNNPLRGNVPTGACAVPLCSDPYGGKAPEVR